MADTPQNFNGHIALILASANDLQQAILVKSKDLRGAQRKYVAEQVLPVIERQLVSLQNITLKPLIEETEEEPEPSAAPPEPAQIKAPAKYKKNINPKSVRALNFIIRAANRVQSAIHEAITFFVEKTPFMRASQRSAASRAVAEMIRNLRLGRDQLSPPAKPEEVEKSKEVQEALMHFITLSEATHDEREYIALIQRAQELGN